MNLKHYKKKAAEILSGGGIELYVATFILLFFIGCSESILALFQIPETVLLIVLLLILIFQRGFIFGLKKMYVR